MDATRSDRNPAAEPPDLRYQWMIFGILSFSHFLMAMFFFGWGPLAPMLKGELGIDNSQLGFIVSAMYFAMMLVSVPSGFLVDRYGARVMLMISVSLVGLATLVLSLSSSYTILFLVAALGGAGYGMINQIHHKGPHVLVRAEQEGHDHGDQADRRDGGREPGGPVHPLLRPDHGLAESHSRPCSRDTVHAVVLSLLLQGTAGPSVGPTG